MLPDAEDGAPAATRSFLSEGAGYTLVDVAQQALTLIVLPVFFFFLTVEDFGIITLSTVLTQFGMAMGTLGLDFSVMRLYYRWSSEERRMVVAGVTLVSLALSGLLIVGVHLLLLALDVPRDQYWPITLGWWSGLILSVRGVPLSIARVQGAIRTYAGFVLGGAVLQVIVQAVCVIVGLGAFGYMLGYAVGVGASAVLAFSALRREFHWTTTAWRLPVELITYTARVLPSVLFSRFVATADRLVLARWASTEALGVYGAASRFTTPVKFLFGGFKMAVAPVLTRQERSGSVDEAFTQLGQFIVSGMLLVGSVVSAAVWFTRFTPWGDTTPELQRLIALLLVAQFLSGLTYLGQLRLYYSPRPWTSSLVSGVNAVALVAGLIVLVPKDGATGAAVAELLAGALAVLSLLLLGSAGGRPLWGPLWGNVALSMVTFVPCVAAAWVVEGAAQLAVFVATLLVYAVALGSHVRRHHRAALQGLWGQ